MNIQEPHHGFVIVRSCSVLSPPINRLENDIEPLLETRLLHCLNFKISSSPRKDTGRQQRCGSWYRIPAKNSFQLYPDGHASAGRFKVDYGSDYLRKCTANPRWSRASACQSVSAASIK
jgi:hypothetical protein